MLAYLQLLLLGAIAGFTIFLGLPLAALQHVSANVKGFLNAVAMGILVFLIVDVFAHALASVEGATLGAYTGTAPLGDAMLALVALFGGLAVGLLGLVFYETRYLASPRAGERSPQVDAYRLATMIAIGIGAHNFSEGVAIGQSYASGSVGLAVLLIIGFGAHNSTEGFGIAGPLTGLAKRPSARFLITAGLIGGGPTLLGTILGSVWSSAFTYVLFLSLAGGALVYVTLMMYNVGRRQAVNTILMVGIFVGLVAGFASDLLVTLGGA
ncbi:MAG TPA: ZIP family metal transporter [Thermoplasmata archaeon]|nr:ZIP family metal transporter [Thermoplasmata archaeon]